MLSEVMALLKAINGCTFATLDTVTHPVAGVRKEVIGENVILFTNKKVSGYENMVKRFMEKAGKDPRAFEVGDLPWGERVPDTPLIFHKGQYYLQTILLNEGETRYMIGERQADPIALGIRKRRGPVLVNCYKLESIHKITLMGETVVSVTS